MRKRRVVITGMGAISPYGEGCEVLLQSLWQGLCGLKVLDETSKVALDCTVGGLVPALNVRRIPREVRRTMSPMSIYATLAAWEALQQAGLDRENLPRIGIALGSTLGSPQALHDFFYEYITQDSLDSVRSTTFFKIMGHSVASNVAMALGLQGRLLAPAAACASGLVSLGLAYESIAYGQEECMLCGGADEFHVLTVATFDKMQAASHAHNPLHASLPFDAQRSGVVISEGVGILFLESLENALQRNVPVLAEITGYASTTSPSSIVHPDSQGMLDCMQRTLKDAHLQVQDIDYVNAHATATHAGDIAEGKAIAKLFSPSAIPVSSLKGHLGHTLAASGSIESIACVEMLRKDTLLPTLHLRHLDPECAQLDHVLTLRKKNMHHCLKNSFAMGGIYSSMIFSKFME